ncbi:MAG: endolytic transglycosylase MltG [Caulobacteraceae bacterium]|nr:endolytic transglycosylase MltG [Caulobacter sp.]
MSRRRGLFAGFAGALLTFAALALLALVAALLVLHAPGPRGSGDPHGTDVVLRKGAGLQEIGGALERAHVVASAPVFIAAAELTGASRRLKPGEYLFPPRASLSAVIGRIRRGEIVHHRITVPEGWSSQQVMDALRASDVLTGDAPTPPEGAVLPETYDVVRGESRAAVLGRMMDARDRVLAELWSHRRAGLPFTGAEQAVILASIVEKETALAAERPRVAAVYVNRLERGMPLQADPTVIYGLTHGAGPLGRPLSANDLLVEGPYNTYLHPGLPPTAIGNPGRASLAAVMDPPVTPDLYFVASGGGGPSLFSSTLEQHNANVAKLRAWEKAHPQVITTRTLSTVTTTAPAGAPLREHR